MIDRRTMLAGLAALLLPRGAVAQAPAFDAEAAISAARLGGQVAFAALDTASGRIIASRNADLHLAPASTLKTVTALFALDRLGAQHRFVSRVLRLGDTLILAGGGDPVLDTDALARLAQDTVSAWQGDAPRHFLIWGGALPRIDRLSPSQQDYLPYNPTVSGMILNFNRVHLNWRAGKLSLQARGETQSPRAYTVTVAGVDRGWPLFTYDGSGARETWTIARDAMGPSGSRWLPVRRPELYAGDVFQTLCRARGLVLPPPEITPATPQGDPIALLQSPPLVQILRDMLEYSTNLTAEVVGLTASGAADLSGSAGAMADWIRSLVPGAALAFHDHSGLSPDNRISALTLARLMAGPGQERDLAGLLKQIPLRDDQGGKQASQIRILAKTGTLNFVSNLTGYAQGPTGPGLAFAILAGDEQRRAASEGQELPQGVLGWTRRAKQLQQELIKGWCARA